MGLAAPAYTLLTLTARKSDIEYDITRATMQKRAMANEMSNLTQEYRSRLNAKRLVYYNNGKYNDVNYGYLMGYNSNYMPILNDSKPLKTTNSLVLCDYKGQVVLSDAYANAIKNVMGSSIMDSNGRGKTFDATKIPDIMASFLSGYFSDADMIRRVHNGENLSTTYDAELIRAYGGQSTGESAEVDITEKATEKVRKVIDFYYNIFAAAAANGWTTEYNQAIADNPSYISDAVTSGTLQLFDVDPYGQYCEGTSLTYFINRGDVDAQVDLDAKGDINAWYEIQKDLIKQKEEDVDLCIQDWSTELETINTEIDAINNFIQDGIKAFEWGG
ncbi:MAG: hypothetical protein MJ237_04460 [bacterium]|nr:hypothetical protein [bacterium]